MKKELLSILFILAGCSSNNTGNEMGVSQTNNTNGTIAVYEEKVSAFICDDSKKGDFTYCDIKGEEITGIVKSDNGHYTYYEEGEEIDGVIFYPDNKVRTYHVKEGEERYTTINYYGDGSIASIDIEDKIEGHQKERYKKGQIYTIPNQEIDIEKFTQIVYKK